jgi:hypothetical protein
MSQYVYLVVRDGITASTAGRDLAIYATSAADHVLDVAQPATPPAGWSTPGA